MNTLRFIHDVETTGFSPNDCEVVEVGTIAFVDGAEIVSEFSSLVGPGREHLEARGMAELEKLPANGIPVADVLNAPPKELVAALWHSWIERISAGYPRPVVSHHSFNGPFDSGFLGRAPWSLAPEQWGECIMRASQDAMGSDRWPKLSRAAEHFGVTFDGEAHRGGVDATVATKIYREILRLRAK